MDFPHGAPSLVELFGVLVIPRPPTAYANQRLGVRRRRGKYWPVRMILQDARADLNHDRDGPVIIFFLDHPHVVIDIGRTMAVAGFFAFFLRISWRVGEEADDLNRLLLFRVYAGPLRRRPLVATLFACGRGARGRIGED